MCAKRIGPAITSRARSLRGGMTDVERLLWRSLRSKQLNAGRFRRQHPIGPYIADFAYIEQKLVIELDGGQHQEREAQDKQRTIFMQSHGRQVLRFWNNDVQNNLDGVLSSIAERLNHAHPS